MEVTLEDANTGPPTDHVEREASSCFAVAAYVKRINKTAGVFTHNKPPRPPCKEAKWEGTEGGLPQVRNP
jgi:hypothetical protein